MAELPDLAYNQSIPANWWETDLWTPTRFAYGMNTYGGNWGTGTDTMACMANNVYLITLYLKAVGWSFQSIMATVANYHGESNMDPRKWNSPGDSSDGFGLPFWTPQSQYQGWAENIWDQNTDPFAPYFYNGWYELYIQASEVFDIPHSQWVQHSTDPAGNPATTSQYYPYYPGYAPDHDYRITFSEFAHGIIGDGTVPDTVTDRLNYLTGAFYWDYEQVADYVADYTIGQRRTRAMDWYNRMRYRFNDFAGRQPSKPPVPDPDYTMADIKGIYPPWWYKIFYMASHKQGGWSKYAR